MVLKGGDAIMKPRHKYVNPLIIFLCVFIFGLFIFGASAIAVKWGHAYLSHLFPNVFPTYNQIHDPASYQRLERIKDVIAIFLSLLIINFISLRIDNRKYERIALITEGQYLIKDGIKLYFKEFFRSDLIISTVIPAVLVIPAYLLSEDALGYFGLIFWNWLGYRFCTLMGLLPAMLLAASFSFVGRMILIPHCVKAWRSAWLTDI